MTLNLFYRGDWRCSLLAAKFPEMNSQLAGRERKLFIAPKLLTGAVSESFMGNPTTPKCAASGADKVFVTDVPHVQPALAMDLGGPNERLLIKFD